MTSKRVALFATMPKIEARVETPDSWGSGVSLSGIDAAVIGRNWLQRVMTAHLMRGAIA